MQYSPVPDTYGSRVYGCSYEICVLPGGRSYELLCCRHGRVEKSLTFATWAKARNQIHSWERDGGHVYSWEQDVEHEW